MARIAGTDLPNEKRLDIGLTYIFGIGRSNVLEILSETKIEPTKRIKDLSEEEVNKLQRTIEKMVVEGDLRREIERNIRRLEDSGSYRGLRHRHGLPSRGQRTRSNARTRKGRRKTVGSIRKDMAAKAAPVKTTAPAATGKK